MKTYKFIKENNKWYIDLPNWIGSKSSLQMVAGADKLLDLIAKGDDSVLLLVSLKNYDGANHIKKLKNCLFNGANYYCEYYDNIKINHKFWLCNVTKYLFNQFPNNIYFNRINIYNINQIISI